MSNTQVIVVMFFIVSIASLAIVFLNTSGKEVASTIKHSHIITSIGADGLIHEEYVESFGEGVLHINGYKVIKVVYSDKGNYYEYREITSQTNIKQD